MEWFKQFLFVFTYIFVGAIIGFTVVSAIMLLLVWNPLTGLVTFPAMIAAMWVTFHGCR